MNRITIIFFILLLNFSCSEKNKNSRSLKENNLLKTKLSELENDNAELSKQNSILKSSKSEKKKNEISELRDYKKDTLKIICKDTIISLISIYDAESSTEEYSMIDSIKNPFLHLFRADYYESEGYFIANKKTGVIDTIWSPPIFSPNDSLFVSLTPESPYEGAPHGYQIWKLNESNVSFKIKEVNQKKWHPLKVRWSGNSKFYIEVAKMKLNEWEVATIFHNEKDTILVELEK